MKRAKITNIPKNPKVLYDTALSKSYHSYVDELDTKDNPGFARQPSKLTYEQAFEHIQNNKPHWVISFRQDSYFGDKDYWEFSGRSIGSNDYGSVFIWILVDVDVAEEIFKEFNLIVNEYSR